MKTATFKHITGGVTNDEDYSTHHWPNAAAEGCAISLTDATVFNSIEDASTTCVSGHTTCVSCSTLNSQSCSGLVSECSEETSYSTPYGEISVASDGTITVEYSEEDAYTPVVDSSVFEDSLWLKNYKQQHSKIKSSFFKFQNVLAFVATIIILSTIAYYIRKQKINKYNRINNNNFEMYEVITNDDNSYLINNDGKQNKITTQIKTWIKNQDVLFNLKTWISNKYYNVNSNDVENNYHSNNDEYLNIDDISSLNYQETAVLLSNNKN